MYYYYPVYYPLPHAPLYEPRFEQTIDTEEHVFHPIEPALHEEEERQQDYGNQAYVVDMKRAADRNHAFRRTIWTGEHFQVTLMNLAPGENIGLERHAHNDQLLRVEAGHGIVQMGNRRDRLDYQRRVSENDAIIIPAGKWHNLQNTGGRPLKLSSIYAPKAHPHGTIHQTKQEAMAAEHSY